MSSTGAKFIRIVKHYKHAKCENPTCPNRIGGKISKIFSCKCGLYDFCDEKCQSADKHECTDAKISNELIMKRMDNVLQMLNEYLYTHGVSAISSELPCIVNLDLNKVFKNDHKSENSTIEVLLLMMTKTIGKEAHDMIDNSPDNIIIMDHYKIIDRKCVIINVNYNIDSRVNRGHIISA